MAIVGRLHCDVMRRTYTAYVAFELVNEATMRACDAGKKGMVAERTSGRSSDVGCVR